MKLSRITALFLDQNKCNSEQFDNSVNSNAKLLIFTVNLYIRTNSHK